MRRIKRHVDRLNGHRLVIVFTVAILLIVAAIVVRSRQTAAADLHICHAQQQDRNVLRSILVLARDSSRRRHTDTPDSEAFYAEALRLARPIDCKKLPSLVPLPLP